MRGGTRSAVTTAAALLVLAATVPAPTADAALLKIRSSAFRAMETDADYDRHPGAVGVSSKGSTFARFTAPIRLPAGARITTIRFYYTSAAPGDVFVRADYLDPQDPSGDVVNFGAAVTTLVSGENSPGLATLDLSTDPADTTVLARRSYFLTATAQPAGFLWEVRVSYEAP